jgi:small subunit ribosomal protein S13
MIPKKKQKIIYLLSNVFGINISSAKNICKNTGINPTVNIDILNRKKINNIKIYLKQYYLTKEKLKKQLKLVQSNLTRIRCYRGLRHKVGLPVRGQRTHTNAKKKIKFKTVFKKKKKNT